MITSKPGARKYAAKVANEDQRHINYAYVQLHEALNELQRVYHKDNVLAHMVHQIGAIEDSLYEYVTPTKGRK